MFYRFIALFVVGVFSFAVLGFGTVQAVQADEPALEVEDEVITMEEFDQRVDQQIQQIRQQMAQMQGEEPAPEELEMYRDEVKQQVVDQLRTQLVLTQAAKDAGIEVSEAEVDETWQQIAGQFASEDELQQALEAQGETEESVREQLRDQVKIQTFLEQEVGEVEVTEGEAREVYDENPEMFQQNGELPEFSEVRGQIIQVLEQQRQQELTQEIIDDLENDEVEVTVHVELPEEPATPQPEQTPAQPVE